MRPGPGLRHNLGLKLLSFALALLLWSFVHGAKVVEREFTVPIRYAHLPDTLVLLEEPPQQLRVLVRATAQELALRLRFARGAEAHFDLSHAAPPYQVLQPSASDVTLPAGVRVSVVGVIEPATIRVHLDRRRERDVPVRATVRGEPAAGACLYGTPRTIPDHVRCSGAATRLSKLAVLSTLPVDLSRRRDSFSARVALDCDRTQLACSPSEVLVQVDLARLASRSLIDTPLSVVPPERHELAFDLRPSRASITLSGPEAQLADLDPGDVALVVDLRTLAAGRYDSLRVTPRLPSWARVVSLRPATVGATIQAKRARAR
jgi:YbbR domain-containing protein